MSDLARRYWIVFFLLAFLLALALIFAFITPEEIVDYVGVRNTYLVSFLLAVFGGLSAVTGLSFFASVVTFSGGGANTLLLALFGGLGIFISDSIFFLVAQYGVGILKKKAKPISLWLISRIENFSLGTIMVGVYIYIGLTPLPNDVLMIALAFVGMPFRRLAPVLMAGSFTIVFLVAYFGEIIFRL